MTSARRLYRFSIALAVLGAAVTSLAVIAALASVKLTVPSPGALVEACTRVLPADLGWTALIVLALLVLGTVVAALWARSLFRQLRASRRYVRDLGPAHARRIAGTDVRVFHGGEVEAFCAGYLTPRIYVSTAALASLNTAELDAVLAHERHHRDRRDPLRLLVIRSLGAALFFMPALGRLTERYAALAELAADEAAVRAKDAPSLASAMLSFGEAKPSGVVVGIAAERVDHLLGAAPRWELPALLLAAAAAAVGGLGMLAILAATAVGAPMDLAMLMAESCMMLLAVAPLVALAFFGQRLRQGRLSVRRLLA